MKRAYITTPIYYPSGAPHLGHAYTNVACDVYARFKRLAGYDVKFLTGTDEHGLKLQRKAEEAGLAPQAYVDKMTASFKVLEDMMNLSNDDFIRTTEERHKQGAQAFWQALADNGWIYKDSYAGWYCVSDEAYFDESELTEQDGQKLAPSGHPVEWMEEESYFFKLSAFQDKLLALYKNQPDFIQPASRRNEVMAFVESGLRDLSISRTTFNWGIPVPGDEKHIMYVWIDALTNYITADGYPQPMPHWPAIHVIGKDILRFHAVYWPAFLMAANVPLPERIVAHGWWTSEGKKMSKSFGNVVDPAQVTEEFGIDAIRYYLMRDVVFGQDGDFSRSRLIGRLNTELANDLGNLFQRVLAMVQKNCAGEVPPLQSLTADDEAFLATARAAPAQVSQHMDDLAFTKALDSIWEVVTAANKYMEDQKPWELKKTDPTRMAHCLRVMMEGLRVVAVLITPIMPEKGTALQAQLALQDTSLTDLDTVPGLTAGTPLPAPQGVFPRIEAEAA